VRPWPPEEGWWDITPRSAVRQASKQGDEECKSHVKEDSNYSNFSRILEKEINPGQVRDTSNEVQ